MRNIALVVHGGVGSLNFYAKEHESETNAGLIAALQAGFKLLKKGKSAIDVVESAVMQLEDNPFFNAGRGSVLNANGEIYMDASIMDGKSLKAGAVAQVKRVKNPIYLAHQVMTKTNHVFISGDGALAFAKRHQIKLEPLSYFITEHQSKLFRDNPHETVGAVAIDQNGNLAAATSTGGLAKAVAGRIGDSCIIGAGCYANNKSCAVSGTGIGEYLIVRVVAHTISMLVELKNMPIQKACGEVIHKRNSLPKKHMGVIALDHRGNMGVAFNTQMMPYGFMDWEGEMQVQNATKEPRYNK